MAVTEQLYYIDLIKSHKMQTGLIVCILGTLIISLEVFWCGFHSIFKGTVLLSSLCMCSEVGKLLQVQNGTPPSANYNGVDAVHACNILQQLKALYDEAQLTDIVVEVDHGKTFSCHRNVLAAISPYFR